MKPWCSMVALALAFASAALANPYGNIATRNVFALVPPKPDISPPGEIFKPPPDYKLTGIAGFGPNKWALLSKADPGKPPQLFMLREGQREGELEVIHVDEVAGVVRLLNEGVPVELRFGTNGAPKIDGATQRFVDTHTRAHELHQKREAERIARERLEVELFRPQRGAATAAPSSARSHLESQ